MISRNQDARASRAPVCGSSTSLVRLWMMVIPRNERTAGVRLVTPERQAAINRSEGPQR